MGGLPRQADGPRHERRAVAPVIGHATHRRAARPEGAIGCGSGRALWRPTKRFNEQVKRNLDRFPADFMFQLDEDEFAALRSHFATSNAQPAGRGGRRYRPFAFIEHGAIMAATILNSPRATEVSVYVVRAFLQWREVLASHRDLTMKLEGLEQKTEALALRHD
jgi:hypothetical protein